MTATDPMTDRAEPDVGDVLYETRSHERYAVVVAVDPAGVTLRRDGREQFVPHAMFAPWNDASITIESAAVGCQRTDEPPHWTGQARNEPALEPTGAARPRRF